MYESFIYQMYNITFTSLPIMYYALFDFEHEKDADQMKPSKPGQLFFMKHPHLYRIGIEYQCFGVKQFLKWVLYGLWHAALVYLFNFHFILQPGTALLDGKDIGFWVVGHVVYGTCVMVANLVILFKFNNYTGWGEVLCFASMVCYFTIFFLENLFTMFPQVYLIFDTTYMQPMIWIGSMLTLFQAGALELFWYRFNYLDVMCKKKNNPYFNELERDSELAGLITNGPRSPNQGLERD